MIKKILILGLMVSVCLSGCEREWDEKDADVMNFNTDEKQVPVVADDKKYIDELDAMISNNEQKMEDCEKYQEFISSIYLFHEDYHGYLQADYDGDGVICAKMLIETGEMGETSDDKQKWTGQILEDGSLWLTYQSTYDEKYDLPDYIVNEDVLRYSRADYIYNDGAVNVEKQRTDNKQQIVQALNIDMSGNKKEFWSRGDKIYEVDRKSQRLIDETEAFGGLIVAFWEQQLERIECRTKQEESVLAQVEQLMPNGYNRLNDWNNIAVSDLNKDGWNDYVMALYPDDYEEEHRYEEFSPYEMIPEYYASSFWLFLSTGGKEYEQIQLSHTIEYTQSDALCLTEISFIKENLLQLEYFVGRSPWCNAVMQFEYNDEQKDFYIYQSYYRESEGRKPDKLLVGNKEDYGDIRLGYYFANGHPYDAIKWESADDIILSDKAVLETYSDSFQYRGEDLLKEHLINSRIWGKEDELVQALLKKYEKYYLECNMLTDSTFYSDNIISGYLEGYGRVISENEEKEVALFFYPIMIDKSSGEYINIKEYIDKDEFLEIFSNFVTEERKCSELDNEEIERFENAIKNYWDNVNTLDISINKPKETLHLQIVSEGVAIGTCKDNDVVIDFFVIDRECFLDTELWKYMELIW